MSSQAKVRRDMTSHRHVGKPGSVQCPRRDVRLSRNMPPFLRLDSTGEVTSVQNPRVIPEPCSSTDSKMAEPCTFKNLVNSVSGACNMLYSAGSYLGICGTEVRKGLTSNSRPRFSQIQDFVSDLFSTEAKLSEPKEKMGSIHNARPTPYWGDRIKGWCKSRSMRDTLYSPSCTNCSKVSCQNCFVNTQKFFEGPHRPGYGHKGFRNDYYRRHHSPPGQSKLGNEMKVDCCEEHRNKNSDAGATPYNERLRCKARQQKELNNSENIRKHGKLFSPKINFESASSVTKDINPIQKDVHVNSAMSSLPCDILEDASKPVEELSHPVVDISSDSKLKIPVVAVEKPCENTVKNSDQTDTVDWFDCDTVLASNIILQPEHPCTPLVSPKVQDKVQEAKISFKPVLNSWYSVEEKSPVNNLVTDDAKSKENAQAETSEKESKLEIDSSSEPSEVSTSEKSSPSQPKCAKIFQYGEGANSVKPTIKTFKVRCNSLKQNDKQDKDGKSDEAGKDFSFMLSMRNCQGSKKGRPSAKKRRRQKAKQQDQDPSVQTSTNQHSPKEHAKPSSAIAFILGVDSDSSSAGSPSHSILMSFNDSGSDWSESDNEDCYFDDADCDELSSDENVLSQFEDSFSPFNFRVTCSVLQPMKCDDAQQKHTNELDAINLSWQLNISLENETPKRSQKNAKKVHFAENIATVHPMVVWDHAYRASRKGHWEEYARDRERFSRRIVEAESLLAPVFKLEHRENIFQKYIAT